MILSLEACSYDSMVVIVLFRQKMELDSLGVVVAFGHQASRPWQNLSDKLADTFRL